MVPAVRPLGPLSMARGCARIDSRPDTAKIGSVDRVEVHHARLLAVIGIRKTFPHGLGQKRKCRRLHGMSVLPPRADIVWTPRDVRKVPNSDIVPRYPQCGVFLYSCQRRSFFRMHILSSLTTRTCKMNMESCYEHHSNSGFST